MLPLIYIDRDGTLIEDRHYLADPKLVKLLPGALAGLKMLKKEGFTVVVISNQSGIGRGLLTRAQVESVNHRFLKLLASHKVKIAGLFYCPHRPAAGCSCRKPRPGLIKRAARSLGRSWRGGISIGDKESDVQLGRRSGGSGILVRQKRGRKFSTTADYVAGDFRSAVKWIIRKAKMRESIYDR
jgi:D-glycero-D-manno-heptose 1,7-bisphosphate phosphatase